VLSAVRSAECRVPSAECRVPSASASAIAVRVQLGLEVACQFRMGWHRFTEIEAWKLSMKLRQEVDAILDRPPACKDRKFCEETRDAAESSPRNIAEGFGRYGNKEFANFVNIARASQLETQTNLIIARDRKFVTSDEFERLWALSEETVATTTGLLKSLRSRGRR
jgi:four helix bundle protein